MEQDELSRRRAELEEEKEMLRKIIFDILRDWVVALKAKEWGDVDVIDIAREIYVERSIEVIDELIAIEGGLGGGGNEVN